MIMEDGHAFHETYAEFLGKAEEAERNLRRQGHATVRVYLRMDEFIPWCRGRKIDAQARAEFAARKAAQSDGADAMK